MVQRVTGQEIRQHGRWWLIVSVVSCFFWLSVEDTTMLNVVVLGVNLTGAMVYRRWTETHDHHAKLFSWLMYGVFGGAGSILSIVGLMFFKTAWHSHQYPDFPLPMMIDMLARMSMWAFAGLLMGLAGYAIQRASNVTT